jgi:hypothetical protein
LNTERKVHRTSSGKSWKTTKGEGDVPRFAGLPHVSRRRDSISIPHRFASGGMPVQKLFC